MADPSWERLVPAMLCHTKEKLVALLLAGCSLQVVTEAIAFDDLVATASGRN